MLGSGQGASKPLPLGGRVPTNSAWLAQVLSVRAMHSGSQKAYR